MVDLPDLACPDRRELKFAFGEGNVGTTRRKLAAFVLEANPRQESLFDAFDV